MGKPSSRGRRSDLCVSNRGVSVNFVELPILSLIDFQLNEQLSYAAWSVIRARLGFPGAYWDSLGSHIHFQLEEEFQ